MVIKTGTYLNFYSTAMKELLSIKLTSNVKFKPDYFNKLLNELYGSGLYGLFRTNENYAEYFLDYFMRHLNWKTREEFIEKFDRDDPVETRAEWKENLTRLKRALKSHKFLVFSIG